MEVGFVLSDNLPGIFSIFYTFTTDLNRYLNLILYLINYMFAIALQ